ncbi:MAG: DUF4743 domain-containing protein [Rubrivivax sp.]|nr:DUF4743 domain-containing protein [Rubrivivax sp.]
MSWAALEQARRHDAASRLPFCIAGREVGSVARADLALLAPHAQALQVGADAVALTVAAAARDAALATINQALRDQGRLPGWRDEIVTIVDPTSGQQLARGERAAARFWGTLTLGAHATGYVAGADGRPAQLWIARRSATKATDPGMLDNLIGGGVPAGQSPAQTLVREGWEEAGLRPDQVGDARSGRVIALRRDISEGLQHEWLYTFDLELPAGLQPLNQDGEVATFELLPIEQALALAADGAMTVDAALVTLDFALRHRLLAPAPQHALGQRLAALLVAPASGS